MASNRKPSTPLRDTHPQHKATLPRLQSLRKRSTPSPKSPSFPTALTRLQTLRARSPATTSPLSSPTTTATTTATTKKRKPTSPPTPRPPKHPRTAHGNDGGGNNPQTPPIQTVAMPQLLDVETPSPWAGDEGVESSPGVFFTHPHLQGGGDISGGSGSSFAVPATTTPAAAGPAPFQVDLSGAGGQKSGLGPPIEMAGTGTSTGGRVFLPGDRALEPWREGIYRREAVDVQAGRGRGRGRGRMRREIAMRREPQGGSGRVLGTSPLASTPRGGRGSLGVGISAQFRPPPPATVPVEDDDDYLEVWEEYPAAGRQQPPPSGPGSEASDPIVLGDSSSEGEEGGEVESGTPLRDQGHTRSVATPESGREYPFLGEGHAGWDTHLESLDRSGGGTGAGLVSPGRAMALPGGRRVSFHLAAKTTAPAEERVVRFELCYDDSESESGSEGGVEAGEGVVEGENKGGRAGREVEQEEEETQGETLTQPQREGAKKSPDEEHEPAPWPPIPGTVACRQHMEEDVARWWRIKQKTMKLVSLLGSALSPAASRGVHDSGLQSLAGRALEQMEEKEGMVKVMQRFRFEESRFEIAKAGWLERWTKNIREGVDGKTGAVLDDMMWYLPFKGWGAYWVRQKRWRHKGGSGGEDVGWGDGRLLGSTGNLTKKQRDARAEKFSSRGVMDMPVDVKGVLLMERVVKWWTAEESSVPERTYRAVLGTLDDLALEVGLVSEEEILRLTKRLGGLVYEVGESQVVIRYPGLYLDVDVPPANKNTHTWWKFDHELANAGKSLGLANRSKAWLGDQSSALMATMASKTKQLRSLNRPQAEKDKPQQNSKLDRFVSKWQLDMSITEVVERIAAGIREAPGPTKLKPKSKTTYNEARLSLDRSARSLAVRKLKNPMPCWYHWRDQNLLKAQERRRKHRPPVPWKVGSIYGRPWILPLLQTFETNVLPMVLEKDLVEEFEKLMTEERGAVELQPLPGLKFLLDASEGESMMVLMEMGSIFDDIVGENWGNCTPVTLRRPLRRL